MERICLALSVISLSIESFFLKKHCKSGCSKTHAGLLGMTRKLLFNATKEVIYRYHSEALTVENAFNSFYHLDWL